MMVYCVFHTLHIDNEEIDTLEGIFEDEQDAKNHIRKHRNVELHLEAWNVQ